ncbi:hypothetical protein FOZ62_003385, partial [Perkinsus olseni]
SLNTHYKSVKNYVLVNRSEGHVFDTVAQQAWKRYKSEMFNVEMFCRVRDGDEEAYPIDGSAMSIPWETKGYETPQADTSDNNGSSSRWDKNWYTTSPKWSKGWYDNSNSASKDYGSWNETPKPDGNVKSSEKGKKKKSKKKSKKSKKSEDKEDGSSSSSGSSRS